MTVKFNHSNSGLQRIIVRLRVLQAMHPATQFAAAERIAQMIGEETSLFQDAEQAFQVSQNMFGLGFTQLTAAT